MASSTPLHQELSSKLAELIRAGTFPRGGRFPSIRQTSREHHVSISTVVEAYRRLEDERLIAARPRSGYFVAPPEPAADRFPQTLRSTSRPIRLRPEAIFDTVWDYATDPAFVPFATAAPGNSIVPSARLSAIAREVMRKRGPDALRYTPPQGRHELRAALSRRLYDNGLKVTPDDIVTTQGATEGLWLALRALTQPGDLVAVETPSYFGTLNLIRELGLRVIEIPVDPRTGLVLEKLETALKRRRIAACVVQPNFHNPIGSLMPESHKAALAALADSSGCTLIEDDVYGDLAHDGHRPPSLSHYSERVITCASVSKTLAPGMRVGWVIPGAHLAEIRRLKGMQCPWNNTLSELIVAEFLNAGGYDRHLRRIRQLYSGQCAKVREAVLDSFPRCTRVNDPAGGFVLWVEMPEGFDSRAYTEAALEKGITLSPGTIFSPSGGMNHCFRLSCGFEFDGRSQEALATLARLAPRFLTGLAFATPSRRGSSSL